jgi:nicotinate-nucleotide adenylyltransferase
MIGVPAVERLGLFGGSFDPIHRGHIDPVRSAAAHLQLQRVLYLPTARPPHKPGREFVAAARRFAMVELALLDEPVLQVDDFELSAQPSYTVDTVRAFSPGRSLFLFLGADSFLEFDQWKSWREIAERCDLVLLRRPGYEIGRAQLSDALREGLDWGRIHQFEHRAWDVSSTEVRRYLGGEEQAAAASSIAQRVPPAVLKYIRKYGLYRSHE